MTQLLISVKNAAEALIALDAGVDIVDLKDPAVGALGALDIDTSVQIIEKIRQKKVLSRPESSPLTSATVGENHRHLDTLIKDIENRIAIGVDIIKVAASSLNGTIDAVAALAPATKTRLIAVFFAEQTIDLNLLAKLKHSGFYGAMIDTQYKQKNLFDICSLPTLQSFTQTCRQYDLKSGLAGSLKPQDIERMTAINPSYIGFRGGVCLDNARNSALISHKIDAVKKMLQEHNKFNALAQVSRDLALHS